MIETWVRPGREVVLQTRFKDTLKLLKRERGRFRPAFNRVASGVSRTILGFSTKDGRDASIYDEIEGSIGVVQDILSEVANSQKTNTQLLLANTIITTPTSEVGFILNGSSGEISTSETKTGKKRGRERFTRGLSPQSHPEATSAQDIARTYKLCLIRNTGRADGTFTIQDVNGWIDKKIANIAKESSTKGQTVRAMVNYLCGDIHSDENVQGGRAASRHPSKKMKGQTVGIEGRSYRVRTLKPDGITSVTLAGKELARVRITYTTVEDRRIILGIFTDRDSYERAHS